VKETLNDEMAEILTRVHVTTSLNGRRKIFENRLTDDNLMVPRTVFGENGPPIYIGVSLRNRTLVNQILFCCYKAVKVVYISLWYYFAPFYALYASFLVFTP
jgi:hypothetical protein